jgi:hypothetical protein
MLVKINNREFNLTIEDIESLGAVVHQLGEAMYAYLHDESPGENWVRSGNKWVLNVTG